MNRSVGKSPEDSCADNSSRFASNAAIRSAEMVVMR
jgi:hypothetical protein